MTDEDIKPDVRALMKRCQIGCGGRNALDDAHSIMAECYGMLGRLAMSLAAAERERDEAAAGFVIVAEQLADVLDIIAETFNPPEPLASRFVAARAEVRARLAEVQAKEGQA
jgi:hypothetical protein